MSATVDGSGADGATIVPSTSALAPVAGATVAGPIRRAVVPIRPRVPITPLTPFAPAGQGGSAGATARDDTVRGGRRASHVVAVAPPSDPQFGERALESVVAGLRIGPAGLLNSANDADDESFTEVGPPVAGLPRRLVLVLRSGVGLGSDVGALSASLVNNLAVEVAAAFGPDAFFGIPWSIGTLVADSAGDISKVLSDTPLDAVSTGPFPVDYGVWNMLAFFHPTQPPPGANDPTVTVTPEHPLPIILLNPTSQAQGLSWSVGAPALANAGYKVYTFNYGNTTDNPNALFQAIDDIRESGEELSVEVDRVLKETGAKKVILIGHSQGGGILPAYYINVMDNADKVSQVIGIAPSNHGTDLNGIVYLQRLPILGTLSLLVLQAIGPALAQQQIDSPFQEVVYGDGDTRPGVQYTNIITENDWIVTPYTQQALEGPDVVNIILQDQYRGFISGHINLAVSATVWNIVLDALAANPEANPVPAATLADVSKAA